jgi:hypothetical protein
VPGIDPGGIGQNHEFLSNATQDVRFIASRKHRIARAVRKERVTGKELITDKKTATAWSMTRRVDDPELFRTELDDLTVS